VRAEEDRRRTRDALEAVTHTLDFMLWVVPAFQNWAALCENANALGATANEFIEHEYDDATCPSSKDGGSCDAAECEACWDRGGRLATI
jgi:hypothetical protein